MAKKTYDERSVVAHIKSIKGASVRFSQSGDLKRIEVDKMATNIGIHTWGKIDYLVNHCGYVQGWFSSTKAKTDDKKEKNKKNKKPIKRVKFTD